MPIKMLVGRQIYDSRGIPTVEVDMVTELGLFRIGVPSTDHKKPAEAVQLRDKQSEHSGMGVLSAVKNINTIIAPELMNQNFEVTMQKEIDNFMLGLDGTESRYRIGANAIMCVSLVVAKAGAAKRGVPLYRHIADFAGVTNLIIPVPHFTILIGGTPVSNDLPFQEYMIMPTGARSFKEAMRIGTEFYNAAKNTIKAKYGASYTCVGDTGGFPIPVNHRDALSLLNELIKQCNLRGKVEISLNNAATDMYKDDTYDLNFKNPNSNPQDYVSGDRLGEEYITYNKEYGVTSLEDPFEWDDWASWAKFTARTQIQIIGNDLTQTNARRVGLAIEKKAAHTLTIRLSQSATFTELIDTAKLMKSNNMNIIVSDRWGDTDDLFLADLAVGLAAGQIKCGAPTRGERISKYNHVLRIEEELGSLSKYAGKNYRVS